MSDGSDIPTRLNTQNTSIIPNIPSPFDISAPPLKKMTNMNRFWISLVLFCVSFSVQAKRPVSPNGKLSLKVKDQGFVLYAGRQVVLEMPSIGYEGMTVKKPKLKLV